ncbi:hypothetical protein SDC9_186102 [bioreactor metagenome]|uniref:Uncharacterized protein n=1 Tax=bioreactor metagenome TaxID=1076179 RepID=A0A645HHR2_9ZZZZ
MVMAVRAMHVLVRDFLGRCSAHIRHLGAELQCLARQRMVAVQMYLGALDLDDVENHHVAIVARPLELPPHLHSGRELALGNHAHQALVALAERIGHGQIDHGGETIGLPLQRSLDLGENVLVPAMQIGHVARIQRLAGGGVGDLVAQRDGCVFGDVHAINFMGSSQNAGKSRCRDEFPNPRGL